MPAPPDRRGATVWITGLPGAGKSTLARALRARLAAEGRPAYVLDGDDLRAGLSADLGFSAADRAENVRRTSHVARLFSDAGLVAIAALISPYASDRERARQLHESTSLAFVEVFVDTPLEVCQRRDPRQLYSRARRGEVQHLTGVSDPYEPPQRPDVWVSGHSTSIDAATAAVLEALEARGVPLGSD